MIKFISLLFAILSLNAVAAGYTGKANVTRFSSQAGSGSFEIYGAWGNPDECATNDKYIVGAHSTDTEQSQNSKYSTVLAAYMAQETIELYVDGCNQYNQPIVKGIYVPARN